MARYELHMDFGEMRDRLAEIEQHGPQRKLQFATLHNAVGVANMVRMAAGSSCTKGPRKMTDVPSVYDMTNDAPIVIKIIRTR